jgi:hypothetical protein
MVIPDILSAAKVHAFIVTGTVIVLLKCYKINLYPVDPHSESEFLIPSPQDRTNFLIKNQLYEVRI